MKTIATHLIALLIGSLAGIWYERAPLAPIGEAVLAKPDAAIRDVGKDTTLCATVQTYKKEAKAKLKLPAKVQSDERAAVLSSVRIMPDLYPHRVTGVIDKDTGRVDTYDQRLELPWLAPSLRGEAGISYGNRSGERVVRLSARQALFDVKAAKVGAEASYDHPMNGGNGSSYVGIGAWYRW